jgi:hypothetical protein
MNPDVPSSRRQRGAALVIALIMLVALGLLAGWTAKAGYVDMLITTNSQSRSEALAAAQVAVEQTLSSPLFVQQTAAVAASPVPVDLDGDGTPDYTATLSPAPACYRMRVLKVAELDASIPANLVCLGSSSAQNAGVEVAGAASGGGDSLCASSEWNIRARVTDPRTRASVAVNQGVAIRSLSTDAANNCP